MLPVLACALLAVGLPASLFAVLRTIRPDADTATPAVVAAEVARHGLGALLAWHYTQDNWLFSIILPDLALYGVLGSAPWLALAQGWLLLVACCGLVALLARRLMPGWAALCLGALLLFAHPDSLGRYGFLANPVSHGVTMAWGLLGLLLATTWIERGGMAGAGAVGCLAVAGTSDPWAKAALLLPLLLACLACAAAGAPPPVRRRLLALAGLALLGLLAGTQWFGLFGFLPSTRFQATSPGHLPAHAAAALEVLASYFSVLPGHGRWAAGVTLALLGLLLAASARGLLARGPLAPGLPGHRLLPAFCALSCAGTAAAFILSDLEVGPGLGRMMLNSYYLLPLLLAAGLRRAAPPWRLLAGAGAALLVSSALYETARLPSAPEPGPPGALYAFLERHGLSYGYGPYWPTQANASGWITRGSVVIRPLEAVGTLPLQARSGGQVFPWWYEPGDVGSTDGRVFFVAAPDVETCAGIAACVAVATHSFGAPDQRLDWGGIPVLVWRRAILDHPPDAATRAAAPLLLPGQRIAITAPLLWTGWSPPGPQGAWSSGERSRVMLNLGSVSPGARTLCATLHATGRPGRKPQRVRVLLDGRPVGLWDVASGVARPYCARIVPAAGEAMLTLERPRLPGWRYRRDVPGIALQGLALSGA